MRITFNGFTNNGIHPDNSTVKQYMFASRPYISCDLDVFRVFLYETYNLFHFEERHFSRWQDFPF